MGLSSNQVKEFKREGFLVIEECFGAHELSPIIDEYTQFIDTRTRELYDEGQLPDLFQSEPFERRLAFITAHTPAIYNAIDIMKLRPRSGFDFIRNEKLLDLVEPLIGAEMTCSPIQHIRAKMPGHLDVNGRTSHLVPWHQDAGVALPEADQSFIVTVWTALTDATLANGCLHVIPRAHGQGLFLHRNNKIGTTIAQELMPTQPSLALPMKQGSVLLMHQFTPHRSLTNETNAIRWSIDLRYQKTGTPTGRPFHPEFVVRSSVDPASVINDYDLWCREWIAALEASKGLSFHRWHDNKTETKQRIHETTPGKDARRIDSCRPDTPAMRKPNILKRAKKQLSRWLTKTDETRS